MNVTTDTDTDTGGLASHGLVYADAQRLQQVLLNLLANAIKYNRPGGQVAISFEVEDSGRVRTLIADTGIGIRPEHMAQLFAPFERLGAEQSAIEGTGLGLALSKGLLEAMGGTIHATSTAGIGTTFAIELAGAPTPADPPQQPTRQNRQPSPTPDDLDRPTILYIEDNVSNLKLVEQILEVHTNAELIAAMQGSIGLARARDHNPDLIILDVHLPDIAGEDVLKRLKADPRTATTPVVMLTADASKGLAARLTALGASDFLSKPLDVTRFLKVIATLTDSARHHRS